MVAIAGPLERGVRGMEAIRSRSRYKSPRKEGKEAASDPENWTYRSLCVPSPQGAGAADARRSVEITIDDLYKAYYDNTPY